MMAKRPPYPVPDNEAQRLLALDQYNVLNTPPEPGLDTIVRHAQRIFGVPMAMVSLVAEHRQFSEGGEHRFGAIARDITERIETEARLKRGAEYDALTDLANRTLLRDRLATSGGSGRPVSLILLDRRFQGCQRQPWSRRGRRGSEDSGGPVARGAWRRWSCMSLGRR